eukprot:2677644-Rhodomonas_salina.3
MKSSSCRAGIVIRVDTQRSRCEGWEHAQGVEKGEVRGERTSPLTCFPFSPLLSLLPGEGEIVSCAADDGDDRDREQVASFQLRPVSPYPMPGSDTAQRATPAMRYTMSGTGIAYAISDAKTAYGVKAALRCAVLTQHLKLRYAVCGTGIA